MSILTMTNLNIRDLSWGW